MWVITGARFLNLYLENFAEMLKLQECFLTNNMADKQKLLNSVSLLVLSDNSSKMFQTGINYLFITIIVQKSI